MQAAILAAGKSTRMYPLTLTRPKPLLMAAGKTLLEWNLDSLSGIADEVIIVVGYKKNMIKQFLGKRYRNIRLRYAEQKQQLGTGHAVSLLEPYMKDRFILLMGDDIYSKQDMMNCAKNRYSILTAKTKNPGNFGVVLEKNGLLTDFAEKPKKFVSNTISAAMYCLDKEIFSLIKKIKRSKRNEIELPDAIKLLAESHKIHCVKSKQWLPVGYPSDLLKTDNILRRKRNIFGKSSKTHGKIINSNIGDNCAINGDVSNSIIMDNSIIGKKSTVKNSIIGENSYVSGKISNSVIADNSKIKNSTIRNCKIWPNKIILNKTISYDLK
jgi:NDP-sugar pyrophosphorylase family protein